MHSFHLVDIHRSDTQAEEADKGAVSSVRADEGERTISQTRELTWPLSPLLFAGESWFHYACVRTRSQGIPLAFGPDTGNWKKESDMIDKWYCVDWSARLSFTYLPGSLESHNSFNYSSSILQCITHKSTDAKANDCPQVCSAEDVDELSRPPRPD